MNIFYLSHDPVQAAKYQYNKHVVKMILETAQLLCTAHHELGTNIDIPYKATHKNHPSAIWVRSSAEAYMWAYEHMLALGKEYTKRYGKEHLTIAKCRDVLYTLPNGISIKLSSSHRNVCLTNIKSTATAYLATGIITKTKNTQ